MGKAVSAIVSPVASLLGGGKTPEPVAPPPPPPPPAEMPIPDDAQTKKAQKKRTAEMLSRGGRLSTILTEGSGVDKLGA